MNETISTGEFMFIKAEIPALQRFPKMTRQLMNASALILALIDHQSLEVESQENWIADWYPIQSTGLQYY
jgi:hypothetical protein